MSDCREPAADFRATFGRRSTDDRRTLEALTEWAERLCIEGVVELSFSKSPAGRDRSLALGPPGATALLHVVNSDSRSHVNAYSYSYGSLGRDRFLQERLGGTSKALAALERAELLAEGEKLWITKFGPATLDALRDLLLLARDHALELRKMHAQGVFRRWVDAGMPVPYPAEADYLTSFEAVMPDELCDKLWLPRGSTYGQGKINARMAFSMGDLPGGVEHWLVQMRSDQDKQRDAEQD